jgi:ribonuclease HII
MRRAVENLSLRPQFVITDAFDIPELAMPCRNLIDGDRYIKSVAAASVIAKIERDLYMQRMDQDYPGYGFADHKGYGTKRHQAALAQLGPSPIHRMSYEPLKKFL